MFCNPLYILQDTFLVLNTHSNIVLIILFKILGSNGTPIEYHVGHIQCHFYILYLLFFCMP